jgi:hypothetical protein
MQEWMYSSRTSIADIVKSCRRVVSFTLGERAPGTDKNETLRDLEQQTGNAK